MAGFLRERLTLSAFLFNSKQSNILRKLICSRNLWKTTWINLHAKKKGGAGGEGLSTPLPRKKGLLLWNSQCDTSLMNYSRKGRTLFPRGYTMSNENLSFCQEIPVVCNNSIVDDTITPSNDEHFW